MPWSKPFGRPLIKITSKSQPPPLPCSSPPLFSRGLATLLEALSVHRLVGWSVGWSVVIELESVKTRISAPAHPSATGIGRVSGLVALLLLPNRPRLDCRVSGLVPSQFYILRLNVLWRYGVIGLDCSQV